MLRLLLPLTCHFGVPELAGELDPCLFRKGTVHNLLPLVGATAQRHPVKH